MNPRALNISKALDTSVGKYLSTDIVLSSQIKSILVYLMIYREQS